MWNFKWLTAFGLSLLAMHCGSTSQRQECQCDDGTKAEKTSAVEVSASGAASEAENHIPAKLIFQEGRPVALPPPDKKSGIPLMSAITNRHSSRKFQTGMLSMEQLSTLLYAAHGVSRADSQKRTTPTALNRQDMEVYVATAQGLFLYDPPNHSLLPITPEDIRAVTGKQPFPAVAPINLVYVSDYSKMGDNTESEKRFYSGAHAGFIGQNVYLYCASQGLATVVRAHFDAIELHAAMKLPAHKQITLAQTVGFPASE